MVNRGSNDNFGPSVRQTAQWLIQACKRDPSLVNRVQASGDRLSERAIEWQGSVRKRRSLSCTNHHLAAEADPYGGRCGAALQPGRVTIDTTVQPKAIAFPTDSRLYHRGREILVRLAGKHGLRLRQIITASASEPCAWRTATRMRGRCDGRGARSSG
jgi:hypothetical protein